MTYKGESIGEAADNLLEAIGRCVDNGDFTDVLSDDQSAIMSVFIILDLYAVLIRLLDMNLVLTESSPLEKAFSERFTMQPSRRPSTLDDSG